MSSLKMPICDGYKATHLLRHHIPYKTFIHDVPIVAMTASAIQGDQEKCRRAGMDDYLSKPVKSRTLEKMLVRWSLNKRTAFAQRPASSNTSECSDTKNDCHNTGIPCVGVEDGSPPVPTVEPLAEEICDLGDSRTDLSTPRPSISPEHSFFHSVVSNQLSSEPSTISSSPGKSELQVRRVGTDELAQQSRDDKLIDAAGGSLASPMAHTPLAEKGDSLTEANVQKFQREELRRRLS